MDASSRAPVNRSAHWAGARAATVARAEGLPGIISRMLDLAFPAACAGCGREGAPLCGTCRPALDARLEDPPGVPLGLPASLPAPLVQLEWCAAFTGTVRRALHRLKYGGERRLALPCGAAVARRWRAAGVGGDLLVPVPVHAERRRSRGYDQAECIAVAAGADLGLPVATVLERSRATVAQYDLGRPERAANVAGAFALLPVPAGARIDRARPLAGRWIVLVDDVVTTGSTLAACAEVLLDGGAVAVSAVTVAREQ